jgi:hypothetical protein
MYNPDPDALKAAMEPAEIEYSNDIYGQIEFDIWFCTLKKGVGKTPFIAGVDAPNQRRTAVTVMLADLGGNNYKREFIAEIPTDGWAGVVLPSLKALGITDLSAVNGAFVHAEMVKIGEYKKADGTTGVRTAPKVLTIYKSADECAAAAQGQGVQDDLLTPPPNGANGNGANGTSDAERKVAEAFLPAIVKTAVRGNGVDIPTLEAALKSNPILARYFTIASPEVTQAMTAALAEPAF